jgi:hypothetical protein
MIEYDVEAEDVFAAMAESLVETHALYRVKEMPDPETTTLIGVKPPREIFYRNVLIFSTKVPGPTPPKRYCLYLSYISLIS